MSWLQFRRGCSRVAVYRHAGGGRDQIEVPASLNKIIWVWKMIGCYVVIARF